MLNDNILDTVAMNNAEMTFKSYHVARTNEAFSFLGIRSPGLEASLSDCYNRIETEFAGKTLPDECLRIIFSVTTPLQYQVEVRKLESLNKKIVLSVVRLNERPPPSSAFKWTNRKVWDDLFRQKAPQADDILTIGPSGELIETSRFNIFCFDPASHRVFTPGLDSGCLNGVFRRASLNAESFSVPLLGFLKVSEKKISLREVAASTLFVGNSVRGLLPAVLL